MKTHTGVIIASEIAVTAICAGMLFTKIAILTILVESVVRIVGLF